MISGFEPGTEVKWNLDNVLTTGIVRRVFRWPQDVEVDGRHFHVEVNHNSPSYLIEHHSGQVVVLPHTALMRRHVNAHT